MPRPAPPAGGAPRPPARPSRWQYPNTTTPSTTSPPPGRTSAAVRRGDRAAQDERRWAAKYAAAQSPAQVAAVDFDRLRASLKDLAKRDPALADRRWSELSALLRKLRDVTSRDVTSGPRR